MRRPRLTSLAALALVLALVALAGSALQVSLTVGEALAQSSVRPPENAVNVAPPGGERVLPGGSVRPPAPPSADTPAQPGLPRPGDLEPDEPAAPGQTMIHQQGVNSVADVWSALRKGTPATASIPDSKAGVLVQDGGMRWLQWRAHGGPLQRWGGYALLGMLALLAVFYLLRGPIRLRAGRSGETVVRFRGYERFAHWLLAVSFVVLAITGLDLLYGKDVIVALFAPADDGSTAGVYVGGAERHGWGLLGEGGYESAKGAYATLTQWFKWLHNNVAWAFMLGLAMVFVLWLLDNLPSRADLKWILHGGGFFGGKHVPAKKFNAGQKMIFWAVILLGASISLSGISLLFPYQAPLFSKTFAVLNETGISGVFWGEPLPVDLTQIQEMQYAQIWHAIIAFAMMTIILAHVYIGTLGMEGAFATMGTGRVDRNWAEEHHALWVAEEEVRGRLGSDAQATPAE